MSTGMAILANLPSLESRQWFVARQEDNHGHLVLQLKLSLGYALLNVAAVGSGEGIPWLTAAELDKVSATPELYLKHLFAWPCLVLGRIEDEVLSDLRNRKGCLQVVDMGIYDLALYVSNPMTIVREPIGVAIGPSEELIAFEIGSDF